MASSQSANSKKINKFCLTSFEDGANDFSKALGSDYSVFLGFAVLFLIFGFTTLFLMTFSNNFFLFFFYRW